MNPGTDDTEFASLDGEEVTLALDFGDTSSIPPPQIQKPTPVVDTPAHKPIKTILSVEEVNSTFISEIFDNVLAFGQQKPRVHNEVLDLTPWANINQMHEYRPKTVAQLINVTAKMQYAKITTTIHKPSTLGQDTYDEVAVIVIDIERGFPVDYNGNKTEYENEFLGCPWIVTRVRHYPSPNITKMKAVWF
jgi:hypothetical protein